ncbi:MAG: peptidylprolyl isomerase [Clostridia bacterium]|nr:peptidylprolyl isomerase [Clostridia bacterium]
MSKGARSREANAEKQKLKHEREVQEAKMRKVRKITAIVTTAVILLLVIVTVVGTLIYNSYMDKGEYLREEIAASSVNIDVDGAMMNYFFNDTYNTFVQYYGSYVEYYGLSSTTSLKKQEITEGQTWFEYFMSGAQTTVTNVLMLNESAAANGVSLTADEIAAMKSRCERIDASLYGRGVNSEDIYNAKILEALAYKYQSMKWDEFTPSTSEIQKYYNENKYDFQTASYMCYNIPWSDDGLTQEEAKKLADELAAAKTMDEYKAIVKREILADTPDVSEEDLNTALENLNYEGATYSEGNEIYDWAFGEAKLYDTKIFTRDEYSMYSVFMLTAEPVTDESETVDVRHILFTADAYGSAAKALKKAEEVLAAFNAGDKSEESFALLALEWSEDSGSYYDGGLYTNVAEGEMVTEFNDWCFDSARKTGDVEIIETSYGYHIMYFQGEGLNAWQSEVETTLINEKLDAFTEEESAKYTVEFDTRVLNMIPG